MTLILLVSGYFHLAQTEPDMTIFEPGSKIWVSKGMADGYGMTFGQCLTIKKARRMPMQEVRIEFVEYPNRRFYMRADFGPDYAFRSEPYSSFDFTPEEWEEIRRGTITVGMSKRQFLCIRPLAEEIHYQPNAEGPIEQWVYRENPRILYGARAANPQSQIFFFQNDKLIQMM